MTQPIETAQLTWTSDGIPQSQRFKDVYHSPQGGVEQAHHVFLTGNGLPTRWQGQDLFTIGETGFGLGLNFLVTWAAWRQNPRRCSRLRMVSCELYPLTLSDLAAAQERLLASHPLLYSLAQTLQAHWPALTAGKHTLNLDEGAVQLTLIWRAADQALAEWPLLCNAWYLDGFAPQKNPQMWQPSVYNAMRRHSHLDATVATFTVAGEVRRGLQAAGFHIEKTTGFGVKRQMLQGKAGATACHRVKLHEPS